MMRFLFFFILGFLLGFPHFLNLDRPSPRISPPLPVRENPEERKSSTEKTVPEIEHPEEPLPAMGKLLIVVTPTYNRAFQAAYLIRLAQTLRLVRAPLLWVVVETQKGSAETAEILRNTGVMYRHLVTGKNMSDIKDRGVNQRNRALEHIERHQLDGIVYFADDDNVYTVELFERIRDIRWISL